MKKSKLYDVFCKCIFALIVLMFTTGAIIITGGYIHLWICYPKVALLITLIFILFVVCETYIKQKR